ncbi:hypothetical protein LINGRAHAP2_LOCUS23202 [Linum grandiflorum]
MLLFGLISANNRETKSPTNHHHRRQLIRRRSPSGE